MRVLVASRNIGGSDEDWFYVERDDATGEVFYINEWHDISFDEGANLGKTKILLHKAKGERYYSEAFKEAKKRWHFVEQN
jgi:hypothetical protein